jgi:hypothetical protein
MAFESASSLSRNVACVVLTALVSLFDQAVKSMKGSVQIDNAKKPALFYRMLKKYRDLFEKLVDSLPSGAINYGEMGLGPHKDIINDIINKPGGFTEDDLVPTAGMNVPSFVIGSGMNIRELSGVVKPVLGEDAFSIIHQNLLVVLSIVQKECCYAIPVRMQEVERLLAPADCIGRSMNTRGMRAHYNRPLKNHSCQFFVEYDAKSKSVDLTVQFYGHGGARWYAIGHMAILLELSNNNAIKDFIVNDNFVSFTWVLQPNTDLRNVKNMINLMVDFTFRRYFPNELLLEFLVRVRDFSTLQKRAHELSGRNLDNFFYAEIRDEFAVIKDEVLQGNAKEIINGLRNADLRTRLMKLTMLVLIEISAGAF